MRFYRHSVMCMSLSVNLGIRLSGVFVSTRLNVSYIGDSFGHS